MLLLGRCTFVWLGVIGLHSPNQWLPGEKRKTNTRKTKEKTTHKLFAPASASACVLMINKCYPRRILKANGGRRIGEGNVFSIC